MAVALYLLLLFLQQGNSEETILSRERETLPANISSEETCERKAELCTYTLPRLEQPPDVEQCQDERVRENRGYFVANSALVILVGTSTNLFNLISFIYVYFTSPGTFPWMSERRVLLLLHLSVCDLLYCLVGLPPFVSIFSNGFFSGSSSLCSFTAALRNVIAFADIFTMATIALTTCLDYIYGNNCTFLRITKSPKAIVTSCIFIWLLSFLVISPTIFEFSIGNFGFGGFGWDSVMGICEVTSCRNPVGFASRAVIYLVGVTIPFLVLLLSHIALEVYFIRKKSPMGSCQTTSKNQTMLVVLSLSYAIFTGPLIPVEMGIQMDVFWYLVCYSWYWWMYPVNVFIYIVTDQDFRKLYMHFLKDVYTGCFNCYLEGY